MKRLLLFTSILLVFISLFCLYNTKQVSATESKLYKLQFDVAKSVYYEDINKTTNTSSSGIYELTFGSYRVRSFCIYLYSGVRGTESQLKNGGYVPYSSISIEAHSSEIVTTGGVTTRIAAFSITRQDDSSIIASYSAPNSTSSSSISIYSGSLNDGSYDITLTWVVIDKANNGDDKKVLTATITSSFIVDSTTPQITSSVGSSSLSSDGIYTNSAFSVNFSDSQSGLSNVVMEDSSGEKSTTNLTGDYSHTISVPLSSNEGLYTFYSTDMAGNVSNKYYVYLDKTKPTISVLDENNTIKYSPYLNVPFYIVSSDLVSSVSMKYNPHGGGDMENYLGEVISETNGSTYTFISTDKAGNSASISIVYDSVNPTCSFTQNGETLDNDSVVKGEINVAFSDVGTFVQEKLIKLPGSSSYSVVSVDGYTKSGRYTLLCIDAAGNRSSEATLLLDNDKPSIGISGGTFYDTVVNDFKVSASDELTSCVLYFKTPLMSEYSLSSTQSLSFDTLGSDGKYYFYAIDSAGNSSDVYWVSMSVAVPEATCIFDSENNKAKFTWLDTSYGLLNGEEYTKDTWITEEGFYELVLTNSSNRSATFTITLSHSFEEVSRTSATCTTDEVISYKCKSCGEEKKEVGLSRLGHDLEGELIGATCYEGAYYHYTCLRCGLEFDGEALSPTSHSYTAKVTAPTCLDRGYTTYTCTLCGNSYIDDYVDKLGHNYIQTKVSPTCESDGYTLHLCTRCSDSYTSDTLDKLGHDYTSKVIEPTCTENGYTLHKCTRCDSEIKDNIISPLGHIYEEEVIDSSCETDGCVRHKCLRCSYYYDTDVVASSGHRYFSEVIKQATCTEDGIRFFKCSKCGKEKTEVIKAFGHSFDYTDTKDGDDIARKYICSKCGYLYEEILSGKYQEVSSFASFIVNSYTPYMWYILGGCGGVWSVFIGIKYMIARKMEEIVNAKKLIVSFVLGLIVLAIILAVGPMLITGIGSMF